MKLLCFWYQFLCTFLKGWVYCYNLQVACRCTSDAGLCHRHVSLFQICFVVEETRIEYR